MRKGMRAKYPVPKARWPSGDAVWRACATPCSIDHSVRRHDVREACVRRAAACVCTRGTAQPRHQECSRPSAHGPAGARLHLAMCADRATICHYTLTRARRRRAASPGGALAQGQQSRRIRCADPIAALSARTAHTPTQKHLRRHEDVMCARGQCVCACAWWSESSWLAQSEENLERAPGARSSSGTGTAAELPAMPSRGRSWVPWSLRRVRPAVALP